MRLWASAFHSMVDAMTAFKTVPLCTKSQSQATKDMFRIDKFSSAEFGAKDKKPGFEFFQAQIDSGNPPIVGMDSDSRIESAGWLKITSGGRFTHVINVVGYSEGVDPMTLCPTKYFIVRDSLGRHMKVMPMEKPHKIGAYIRVSTDKQVQVFETSTRALHNRWGM
jgi:hypothetical protein